MTDLERARDGLRFLRFLTIAIVVLALAAAVAGCAGQPQLQPVKVPVPVECREQEPQRPAMPTESLVQGDALDTKVKAALAEIELRDGYEGRLVAALRGCIHPIQPDAPTSTSFRGQQ